MSKPTPTPSTPAAIVTVKPSSLSFGKHAVGSTSSHKTVLELDKPRKGRGL